MNYFLISLFVLLFQTFAYAEEGKNLIDLETAYLWQTKNTFQIPNDSGGARKDLSSIDSGPYQAIRLNYVRKLKGPHSVRVLFAPLVIQQSETLAQDFLFQNHVFQKGTLAHYTYQFNSYRLSYLYSVIQNKKFSWHLGFTAKIRDAMIKVKNQNQEVEKKNLGFVPLLALGFSYRPSELNPFELEFDGDALAAPQGRAEDLSLKFHYLIHENSKIYIGYRLLEGGADNKAVYTFSLFHYALAGLKVIF